MVVQNNKQTKIPVSSTEKSDAADGGGVACRRGGVERERRLVLLGRLARARTRDVERDRSRPRACDIERDRGRPFISRPGASTRTDFRFNSAIESEFRMSGLHSTAVFLITIKL